MQMDVLVYGTNVGQVEGTEKFRYTPEMSRCVLL